MNTKVLFITLILIFSTQTSWAAIKYFNQIYGHVHLNPSQYSESLTTIACAHPVKIINELKGPWVNVTVGAHTGHIRDNFLTSSKPNCFQDRYPKFFSQFEFSLSELYYWGRLSDQYIMGKSTAK